MLNSNGPAITRRSLIAAGTLAGLAAGTAGCSALADSGLLPDDGDATVWDRPAAQHGSAEQAEQAEPEPTAAERLLAAMALEQKVAQLFIVTPEQLTGASTATIAGDMTKRALAEIPVGGLCYFRKNLVRAEQVRNLLSGTRELGLGAGAGVAPFLSIDEEGGPLVARVANCGLFDVERFPNMAEIGATGDPAQAAHVGEIIGTYLREIGFNLDFAPIADVLTNPDNTAIGARSFSSDADLAAQMVAAEVAAMLETGTLPCVKHFPGHGDTAGDSHTGAVYAERTREQIESCEFKPFISAIEAGCPMVMVGHIGTPNFAADGLPASLSPFMMGDILRGELGFEGVIISDSFGMGAITQNFSAADAAVRYFEAGGDILLMTPDLRSAVAGVVAAVNDGRLSEERIDESVKRVLELKESAGIIA
ncbi:glycoside hydrolase family 3 protein [Enorma phocaeensis]|uniref:glycoside hydrolase family 3 protein n=1 Tax=Enorma phocaeensis TaxID=1871019 RepID=UPI003208C335